MPDSGRLVFVPGFVGPHSVTSVCFLIPVLTITSLDRNTQVFVCDASPFLMVRSYGSGDDRCSAGSGQFPIFLP